MALETTRHIGLADRRQDSSRRQVSPQNEEALQVHVQIFSDCLTSRIPASNLICESERKGIHGRWGPDGGAAI
jgi:hypothetical protein